MANGSWRMVKTGVSHQPSAISHFIALVLAALILVVAPTHAAPDSSLPELTQPVNDFAHVVDAASAAEIDRMSRALQAVSGDVVVVATVPTVEPYGDINEYAVKLFENHGRGLGVKGKDNGVLILLALKERRVRIEVGYGLEQWITDGYAGSTSREVMTPEFRNGRYGAGLRAGVEQIVGRIAQARNIPIEGVRAPRVTVHPTRTPMPVSVPFIIFIVLLIISRLGGGPGSRPRFWGGGGWSGWSSGVGPFGGGFGGGRGGGFGGGFGGFGGGGSGGGGGGSSW
ncbi:MAG: TPM domain-containing protein [Acidobacteria bacterium]|nr:TPM domain-containing protein [Acidobacteriota bacterium]